MVGLGKGETHVNSLFLLHLLLVEFQVTKFVFSIAYFSFRLSLWSKDNTGPTT